MVIRLFILSYRFTAIMELGTALAMESAMELAFRAERLGEVVECPGERLGVGVDFLLGRHGVVGADFPCI
jgi:hypothetical protein